MDTRDLAIIDMEIPGIKGMEMTVRLRKQFPDTYTEVATMHDERSLMQSAFE